MIESVNFVQRGQFKIGIIHRRVKLFALTHNTMAVDRWQNTDVGPKVHADGGLTKKQAGEQLRKEVIRANNYK